MVFLHGGRERGRERGGGDDAKEGLNRSRRLLLRRRHAKGEEGEGGIRLPKSTLDPSWERGGKVEGLSPSPSFRWGMLQPQPPTTMSRRERERGRGRGKRERILWVVAYPTPMVVWCLPTASFGASSWMEFCIMAIFPSLSEKINLLGTYCMHKNSVKSPPPNSK